MFVSNPVPQYGQTFNAGVSLQQPMTVDVKIKSGEQTIELQRLPANLSIADYGNGMVISESREAICQEVSLLKGNSEKVIESVERHKAIVQKCDELLQELNPQIRQEVERAKELDNLSKRVGGLESSIADIKGLLIQSLGTNTKEK